MIGVFNSLRKSAFRFVTYRLVFVCILHYNFIKWSTCKSVVDICDASRVFELYSTLLAALCSRRVQNVMPLFRFVCMWTVFIWPSMFLVSIKCSSLWQSNLFTPNFDVYCTDKTEINCVDNNSYGSALFYNSQTPLTGCDSFYKIKKSNVLGIGGFLFVWKKKSCKLTRNFDE